MTKEELTQLASILAGKTISSVALHPVEVDMMHGSDWTSNSPKIYLTDGTILQMIVRELEDDYGIDWLVTTGPATTTAKVKKR